MTSPSKNVNEILQEKERLEGRIESLNMELKGLRSSYHAYTTRTEGVEEENTALRRELDNKNAELQDKNEEIREKEEEIATLKNELSILNDCLRAAEAQQVCTNA